MGTNGWTALVNRAYPKPVMNSDAKRKHEDALDAWDPSLPLPKPAFKRRRQTRKVWIPQQRDATRARTGGKDAAEGRMIFDEVNSMVLSYIRGLDPAQCTEQEVQQHYLECEHEAVETEEDMGHLVKVVTSCVAELVKAGELPNSSKNQQTYPFCKTKNMQ